jgi:hypothetical protein
MNTIRDRDRSIRKGKGMVEVFFMILFMFITNQNQLYTIHIKFTVLYKIHSSSSRSKLKTYLCLEGNGGDGA